MEVKREDFKKANMSTMLHSHEVDKAKIKTLDMVIQDVVDI